MLKLIPIAVILLTSNMTAGDCSFGFASANSQVDVCEPITVACPETVNEHSDIKFEAYVARAASSPRSKLNYHWSVGWVLGFRRGRIKSGQGTSSIVVSVPRPAPSSLTVAV